MIWVLILALAGDHNTAAASSIAAIPGFATEALCKSAGEQARTALRDPWHEARFVCVLQSRNPFDMTK